MPKVKIGTLQDIFSSTYEPLFMAKVDLGYLKKTRKLNKNKEKKFDESFKGFSIKELNKKIAKAIEDENYELAAQLRDEINQRK